MKASGLAAAALALFAPLVGAGIIIAPIRPEQVVEKIDGDCFFGVVTPAGCG
jgi:hypothetical protein